MTNTAHLKELISGSDVPVLASLMLYFMFALTFGSLAMGVAIMRLPYGPGGPSRGPGRDEDHDHPEQ